MPADCISKKTRNEFQEAFVTYYVLRRIEAEFDAADIACNLDHDPQLTGARRTLVAQHYQTLDFSNHADVRKLLTVFEAVLHRLETTASSHDDHATKTLRILTRCLERDGFVVQAGRILPKAGTVLPQAQHTLAPFDLPELERQIQRMQDNVDDDPAAAIGAAKELVETTCKTILSDRGLTFTSSSQLPGLLKLTRKELKLLGDDIPDNAKGAEAIRRVLTSLGTIGQGLAPTGAMSPNRSGSPGCCTTKRPNANAAAWRKA